jgi:hypothetical protein
MIDMKIVTYRRRFCTRALVLAVALASVAVARPAPAFGQEAANRRLEDSFPPEYAAQVREIARNARDAGVPPALIARKAFEGVAKGYPPERIVTALDAYAGRLREASRLMGPDTRPAGLAAAAEALRRGVPPDAIRSMAARRGEGRDLAVPLIVLSDLTEAGVPTRNALEMVNSALDRGARGDRMLGMSAAIRRRMLQGADWRTAVEEVRSRAERQIQQRDRPPADGARTRQNPSRRPADNAPVPPGTEPPQRIRDGG